MYSIPILCASLFLAAFVSFQGEATISVRNRVVERSERISDGEAVSIAEKVTEERTGEDPAEIDGNAGGAGSTLAKRFLRKKRDVPKKVECALMAPPSNGKLVCYYSKPDESRNRRCSAICIPNYKFPDGSARKDFNCTRQGEFWNRIDQPADCQPAKPGIGCGKAIEGSNQLQICKISPERKECKSTCIRGYKFPNDETEIKIVCEKSTGVYDPIDKFPDCIEEGGKDENSDEDKMGEE